MRHALSLLLSVAWLAGALLAQPAVGGKAPPVLTWASDEHLLINNNGLLARFDLNSNKEELLDDTVIAFALHPGGPKASGLMAVATPDEASLRSYPAFDWLAALPIPTLRDEHGAADTVQALAWSANGETLAGGTASGHVLLWDVEVTPAEAGAPVASELWADLEVAPAAGVAQLSFSADGKRLLAVFEDARAVLWDVERRQELQRFSPAATPEGEAPAAASAMLVSPDGQRVLQTWVRGGQAEMTLLDASGKILWRRAGLGVEFTPDGAAVLALVPPYRVAALYRVEGAAALRVFEPPEGIERLLAVRLNPAGTRIAGVTASRLGQGLVVWDAATARVLKSRH
jgi:hypothetical protein